jgi:hypothetical protein
VDLAVAGTPNVDLLAMTLTLKLPKSLQLVDLGIAVLDFTLQGHAKLIHLAIVLHRKDSFLLVQPAVKLQPQRGLRTSSLRQLSFQFLSPNSLSLQVLKLLCMLLLERLNYVGRHRVGQLGLKRSDERGSI